MKTGLRFRGMIPLWLLGIILSFSTLLALVTALKYRFDNQSTLVYAAGLLILLACTGFSWLAGKGLRRAGRWIGGGGQG